MNYKKIFKRETKVIVYVVIALTLVVVGTSYALFLQVNNNTNNQVVQAGTLTVTYSGGNMISVDETSNNNCLLPQSDSDGAGSGGCKFTLSITNTGTLPMQYNLLIYDNVAEAPEGAAFVDHALIRHSLKKQYTVANKSETVTAADALGNLPTYETSKRVLENSVIEAGETITFALNIWVDDNATTDIIGKYVFLKLDVNGSVYEKESATQALLSNLENNGLTEIMSSTTVLSEDGTSTSKEYRYAGINPKNYIYFNCKDDSKFDTCELWRILGIYNVSNGNETEARIKLVKAGSEEMAAWDANGGNTYNTSTLNSYLNNDFYNKLSKTAKSQIQEATYKLGGAADLEINSKELYATEQSAGESINAKVGLMNLSDYVFASGMNDETIISNLASLNTNNWLFKEQNEWLINKNNTNAIYTINNTGEVATGASTEEKMIRPVVYLASNVKIMSGDGSLENPYVLSK